MLQWIPDRSAFCSDRECTVDVLIRIQAERPPLLERRPDINLCLVIDRSGSMGGEKINLTRQAAKLVIRSLAATDFLSIVLFGDFADVLLPSSRMFNKEAALALVDKILVGGSTALHQGWKAGAAQACLNLDQPRLHRVVLLTDGQANVGETNPDRICDEVHKICQQGIQTTTMGFGKDYNENLLRSVAISGDGNHFFVETPDQLSKFFELELDGLAATLGSRVRLRLKGAEGVTIEPLGEVQATADGSYQLADISAEYPVEQLFRMTIPAGSGDAPVQAELTWNSPKTGALESLISPFSLPRVTMEERLHLPFNPEVEKQLAIAMAAKARREALAAMNRGDQGSATQILKDALESKQLPEQEKSQLQQLRTTMEKGDRVSSSKMAFSQSHSYSRGSVVLHNIDLTFVEGVIGQGLFPLRLSPFLKGATAPTGYFNPRPNQRAQHMLTGLQAGQSRDCTLLNLAVLAILETQPRILLPAMAPLAKKLAEAPLAHPSPGYLAFRQNIERDCAFVDSGVDTQDSEALLRVPAMLLSRWKAPRALMWTDIAMASFLTHKDAASLAASVAFAVLLWELLAHDSPPPSAFYAERFGSVLQEVETDRAYPSRAPRFDGWSGTLSQYLTVVLGDARQRALSVPLAAGEWGKTDHLFETVPLLLWILERHAGEPAVALRLAQDIHPAVACLTGAALGALHGELEGLPEDPEYQQALQRFWTRTG